MAKISQGQINQITTAVNDAHAALGLIGITAALVDSGCDSETIDAALIAIMQLTLRADIKLTKLSRLLPTDNGHE